MKKITYLLLLNFSLLTNVCISAEGGFWGSFYDTDYGYNKPTKIKKDFFYKHFSQADYEKIMRALVGEADTIDGDFSSRVVDRCNSEDVSLIRRYLITQMIEAGFSEATTQCFTTYSMGKKDRFGENLIFEIPGTKEKDEVIILGAHFDTTGHFMPGANDNATGVAAVLAIARALKKERIKPRRTIRFVFFDLEEKGRVGSRHYFRDLFERDLTGQVKLFINVDMIGYSPTGKLLASFDHRPFAAIESLLIEANEKYRLGFKLDAWRTHHSDNASAKDRGIPTVSLYEDFRDSIEKGEFPRYPHYHTEADTIDKVNMKYATQMTRLIGAATIEAANSEATWKEPRIGTYYPSPEELRREAERESPPPLPGKDKDDSKGKKSCLDYID